MASEEIASLNAEDVSERCLAKFPFFKLFEIPSTDYTLIRDTVKKLEHIITFEKFYYNFGDYVAPTLQYILLYSNFLVENVNSGPTLLPLVTLLRRVITGMNTIAFQMDSADINAILSLSIKIIESPHQYNIKLEVGTVLTDLIKMQNIISSNMTDLLVLISRVCMLLDNEEQIIPSICLFDALLNRRFDMKIEIGPIIETIEFRCLPYLKQETDTQTNLQILKCLLTYYKTREESNYVTDVLKSHLHNLCEFMSNSLFRDSVEQLLAILIEDLYCTHTLVWPGGRMAILEEIQGLPDYYEEWPKANKRIFIVITYLLFLHSKLLWSSEVLWKFLNNYISTSMILPRLLLKAVIMLYPLGIDNNSVYNINKNGRIILESLCSCKFLPQMLTYHPTQMTWLLTNAKTAIKKLVLVSWLHTQDDDDQILSILNLTKTGFLLVQFFVNYSDTVIRSRVLQLMVKLTPEPNLEKAIELALPLVCTHPTIFAELLQLKPAIPTDHGEVLNLIQVASTSLPFLTEDPSFQAACSYSIRLLNAMKYESNALLMFCHNFTSVRFLVAQSTVAKDDTALAAINLLRRLLNNQVMNNVNVDNSTAIEFTLILQGNLERVLSGLQLLQLVLSCRKKTVILLSKQSLFDIYHLLHTFTRQQETGATAYKILTTLILYENNLAFSLATTQTLNLACKQDMDSKTSEVFLKFLKEWLKFVIQYPYIYVPVINLFLTLGQIQQHNDTGHCIYQLLDKLGL